MDSSCCQNKVIISMKIHKDQIQIRKMSFLWYLCVINVRWASSDYKHTASLLMPPFRFSGVPQRYCIDLSFTNLKLVFAIYKLIEYMHIEWEERRLDVLLTVWFCSESQIWTVHHQNGRASQNCWYPLD